MQIYTELNDAYPATFRALLKPIERYLGGSACRPTTAF